MPGDVMSAVFALMTARSPQFKPGNGGLPQITGEDVAFALGCCRHPGQQAFLRMKYTQDFAVFGQAHDPLLAIMQREAQKRHWRNPDKKTLWLLSMAALWYMGCVSDVLLRQSEFARMLSHCRDCHGRGVIMRKIPEAGKLLKKPVPCPLCDGTGRPQLKTQAMADFLEIDWHSWRDTWEARFDLAVQILDRWERTGLRKMVRVLADIP